jgi:lipopolysaccharide assembly outer membrane protein LptD (OstA)
MFFLKSHFLKLSSTLYFCFLVSINFFIPITTSFSEPGEEVLISSDNAEFDQNLGVILLSENVLLKLNKLTFKSDEMKLIFDDTDVINDNFSNLKKIIAKGNVLFEREKETIKSDLVSFSPKENKITITGNVKVIKGKNVGFTSDLLEINLKNEFLN